MPPKPDMQSRTMNFQETKTVPSVQSLSNHVPAMKKIPIHMNCATFFATLNMASLRELRTM